MYKLGARSFHKINSLFKIIKQKTSKQVLPESSKKIMVLPKRFGYQLKGRM